MSFVLLTFFNKFIHVNSQYVPGCCYLQTAAAKAQNAYITNTIKSNSTVKSTSKDSQRKVCKFRHERRYKVQNIKYMTEADENYGSWSTDEEAEREIPCICGEYN